MVRRLLLINLRALFTTIFKRRRNNSSKSAMLKVGIALLVIYVIGAFAMLVVTVFGQLIEPFFSLGIGWLFFSLNGLIVFAVCVITCIFAAQAHLFNAKDNELLLSMPIKPSTILVSRILSLLTLEFIFEALISIPVLVIWIHAGYASTVGIFFFLIQFLLLPLLALTVACLLAWLLTLITARFRKRNVAILIVSLAFLAAYMWVFSNLQRHIATLLENGTEIAEAFRRGFPPLFYFGRAISEGNPVDLLIFIVFAIVPFAAMIALLSRTFIKVATTKRGAKKIEYRAQAMKASGHIKAINKIELRRYWNNPAIIMNTSIGGIFAIVVGGYLLFAKENAAEMISQLSALLPTGSSSAVLVGAVLAFTSAMNTASSALVSLEGRRLWIVRSLPVNSRDVLLGKLAMHLEISMIPAVIGSILCIIAMFTDSMGDALIVLLLPAVFILASGATGLILNLHIPRFDWINELQPVKQGLPAILITVGMMAVFIGIIMLYGILLSGFLDIVAFAWMLIVVLAVIDFLLIYWIVTQGAAKFDSFDA